MSATSYCRGHKIIYNGAWKYADGSQMDNRPCKRCGKPPTPEGHDACLGHVKGATAACCGHGVEAGYVLSERGI